MKRSKLILILSIILIVPIAIVLYSSFFGGYYFKTEEECIRRYVNQNIESKNVVFKYETQNNEIILYNLDNGEFFDCVLDKKVKNGTTLYRLNNTTNTSPVTWDKEWKTIDKNLKYIYVKCKDDIKDINCKDSEPKGTKIYYKLQNGEKKSCWIYIVDETI